MSASGWARSGANATSVGPTESASVRLATATTKCRGTALCTPAHNLSAVAAAAGVPAAGAVVGGLPGAAAVAAGSVDTAGAAGSEPALPAAVVGTAAGVAVVLAAAAVVVAGSPVPSTGMVVPGASEGGAVVGDEDPEEPPLQPAATTNATSAPATTLRRPMRCHAGTGGGPRLGIPGRQPACSTSSFSVVRFLRQMRR